MSLSFIIASNDPLNLPTPHVLSLQSLTLLLVEIDFLGDFFKGGDTSLFTPGSLLQG